MTGPALPSVSFDVWSTTATLVVDDPAALPVAEAELRAELTAVGDACDRFRSDSELSRLLVHPGREVEISPVLNELIFAAVRVAAATDGLVDPTVAAAVIALGYGGDLFGDRSGGRAGDPLAGLAPVGFAPAGFAAAGQPDFVAATSAARPAPGAGLISHDPATRRLTVPPGVGIDLGATAKAVTADRAAARIFRATGAAVLVSLGGDLAVAGAAPEGGWRVAIGADHRTAQAEPEQVVSIETGGLATSAITVRRWMRGSIPTHHIVDPRTGENPAPHWRSVTAVAGSCLDANAAATAAIVLGDQAPAWLSVRGIPARLVGVDGRITRTAGWPADAIATDPDHHEEASP